MGQKYERSYFWFSDDVIPLLQGLRRFDCLEIEARYGINGAVLDGVEPYIRNETFRIGGRPPVRLPLRGS